MIFLYTCVSSVYILSLLIRISRKGSEFLFLHSPFELDSFEEVINGFGVFSNWSFFIMMKVYISDPYFDLCSINVIAIDSRRCITTSTMNPESSDPIGVPLICC